MVLDFSKMPAVKALFLSAVINGIIAPFLLVGILIVASDKKIMRGQPSSSLGRIMVLGTTILMFFSSAAMFIF